MSPPAALLPLPLLLLLAPPAPATADVIYAIGGERLERQGCGISESLVIDEGAGAADSWQLSVAMPAGRYYHGAGTVNEEIYLVGGRGDDGFNEVGIREDLSSLLRYDALLGSWDTLAPMSTGRIFVSVVGDDEADLLYAVGGVGSASHYLRDAEMYDVRTNTWASLPDTNHPRTGGTAVIVDGVLFVVGGYDGNDNFFDHVEWFDIENDEISCRTDPDCVEELQDWFQESADGSAHTGEEWNAETHFKAGKDDDDISVDPNTIVGRRNRRMQADSCPIADLNANLALLNTACSETPNQVPRECTHACADIVLPFWAACGDTVTQQLAQISDMLEPLLVMCQEPTDVDGAGWETGEETGTHQADPPPPPDCNTGFAGHHATACGGTDTEGSTRAHPCGDDCAGQWRQLDELMSTPRAYACATHLDGKVYVLGGKDTNSPSGMLRTAEVYDMATRTWSQLPDMATHRWGLGCAVTGGKVYALGGKSDRTHGAMHNEPFLASSEVFDPQTQQWSTLAAEMFTPRGFFGTAVVRTENAQEVSELYTPYQQCAPNLVQDVREGRVAEFTNDAAMAEFYENFGALNTACRSEQYWPYAHSCGRECADVAIPFFIRCKTILESHVYDDSGFPMMLDILDSVTENCDAAVYDPATGEFVGTTVLEEVEDAAGAQDDAVRQALDSAPTPLISDISLYLAFDSAMRDTHPLDLSRPHSLTDCLTHGHVLQTCVTVAGPHGSAAPGTECMFPFIDYNTATPHTSCADVGGGMGEGRASPLSSSPSLDLSLSLSLSLSLGL